MMTFSRAEKKWPFRSKLQCVVIFVTSLPRTYTNAVRPYSATLTSPLISFLKKLHLCNKMKHWTGLCKPCSATFGCKQQIKEITTLGRLSVLIKVRSASHQTLGLCMLHMKCLLDCLTASETWWWNWKCCIQHFCNFSKQTIQQSGHYCVSVISDWPGVQRAVIQYITK